MDSNSLNVRFVKDYIDFLKGDNSKINGILKYAFYLLTKKTDELSLNFAYSIIINYSLKYNDYKPLIEFSIIFGYSPILDIIYNGIGASASKEIENFVANYYIYDNKYNGKILTSGQKVIYRMLDCKKDYSIVAPTSFGKTELMLESAMMSKGDCIIIVPLVALLSQVRYDLLLLLKGNNKSAKIITHHEINKSEKYKNIYILTQERCFELIKRKKLNNITDLFIDESHKLLNKEERSYKLSQIILLLKNQFGCNIRYYSPVLYNPNSISIKGVHDHPIEAINGIRDMKCYHYFFYHKYRKEIYFPNTDRMTESYVLDDTIYNDFDDYIINNSKNKNIVFLNSPKDVEKKALQFADCIQNEIEINCKDLEDFIGKEYYTIDTLKKGIIYIHGEMPDLIKFYLLDLYKKNNSIKYLFTNSSVLEGVNTPSDTLFIYDYKIGKNIMKPQDFINLRGRINRINEIIKSKSIDRLICETHFNCLSDGRRQNVRNKIIDPCYGITHTDDINNEYLIDYNKNDKSPEFITSLEQIQLVNENIDIKTIFNEEIENENSEIVNKCLLNNIFLNSNQKNNLEERLNVFHEKYINSIEDLLYSINYIFQLREDDDIALSRLSNEKARVFYSTLLQWIIDGKTIKEKASRMANYYMNKPIGELIYVGKRGELSAELYNGNLRISNSGYSFSRYDSNGNPIRLKNLWIINNRDYKKMYNICVIKVKVEEDFLSFKLIPYIEALVDIDESIINNNLYNLIRYKSSDDFEISLIKEGISIYLARTLNSEKYKKFVHISEVGASVDNNILSDFNESDVLLEELKKFIN